MTTGHTCRLTIRRPVTAFSALACVAIGSACGAFASRIVTEPQPVARELTLVSLAEGGGASAGGLKSGGAAFAWGENLYGNLGDGTNTDRNSPVPVTGGLTFGSLTMGGFHTCGLSSIGAAYCWGVNLDGELGDGTNTQGDLQHPSRIGRRRNREEGGTRSAASSPRS